MRGVDARISGTRTRTRTRTRHPHPRRRTRAAPGTRRVGKELRCLVHHEGLDDPAVEARHDLTEDEVVVVRGGSMRSERIKRGIALQEDELPLVVELTVGGERQIARLGPGGVRQLVEERLHLELVAERHRVAGYHL